MTVPPSNIITRIAYGMRQLPRVAWYLGHGLALRRLAQAARSDGTKARRRVHTDAPVPGRSEIYTDMARLFLQDLANVEAGIYPLPADNDGSLFTLVNRSRLFFEDLPQVHRRRERRAYNEIRNSDTRSKRPRYYLQNFHFQSGGWMTDDSAERYDTQVFFIVVASRSWIPKPNIVSKFRHDIPMAVLLAFFAAATMNLSQLW
jgi:hypothetical protein